MTPIKIVSASEQVAEYLRKQLLQKVWVDIMPGGEKLARKLGVGRMTIDNALTILERDGWLVSQGSRRRRKITIPAEWNESQRMRVAILLHEPSDASMDVVMELKNQLIESNHTTIYLPKSLTEIKMNLKKLARMVEKVEADAWVVIGGTEEVLNWFTENDKPVFAFFGRYDGMKNIARISIDSNKMIVEVTSKLAQLGHRRIVFLDGNHNTVEPSEIGKLFLDELEAHGIATGPYNIPGWEGGSEGLYACLESLFLNTPPTAIVIGSRQSYFAVVHFLLEKGIRVPGDVSLICMDGDPHFEHCRPSVAHFSFDKAQLGKGVVRWVNSISQGKEPKLRTKFRRTFREGGTIGPVSKKQNG